MTAARLPGLADLAAAPTARERAAARAANTAGQRSMFDPDDLAGIAAGCAVCAADDHRADACPHGTALTLI